MSIYRLDKHVGTDFAQACESDIRGAVLLLGYFDGVHRGHSALFSHAVSHAGTGHPIAVWTPESVPKASAEQGTISTREEKLIRFWELGADYAVMENFENFRNMDGSAFFARLIAERFSPYAVICGENFRFGKNAACTADDLADFARKAGILCFVIPLMKENEAPVSSTEIRRLIASGNVKAANGLLGYPYSVTSEVLHGKALGRTIGCPTINQRLPKEKIMPEKGVYACTVSFEENGCTRTCGGVCNIGSRPTVNTDESDITLETYIIDFSGDLYGKAVKTSLLERIRGEKTFASVEELSEQIHADAEKAKEILKRMLN